MSTTHTVDDNSTMFVRNYNNSQHQQQQVIWQQQPPPMLHQISLQPIPSNAHLQPVLIHRCIHQQSNYLPPSQQQPQQQHLILTAHPNTSGTHNLIPFHYHQPSYANMNPSLHGTPGYPPAIIPQIRPLQQQQQQQQQQQLPTGLTQHTALTKTPNQNLNHSHESHRHNTTPAVFFTVQDRPTQPPIYNGINPSYPGLRIINTQPPIFCVDHFLSELECHFLIAHASDSFGPAPVVGKGAGEVSPSRTSSTCYLAREDVPDVLRKISVLTGKPYDHCELPQVGRYFPTQQYLQHYDAFDLSTEDGRRFAMNGGQRTITVLIYLNTVPHGGATRFPALDLEVRPVRGMALVFFPATVDGLLDQMALHAALPAIDTKYVSQVWIRQSTYVGQPSKRLAQPLGVPFGMEHVPVNQPQPAASTVDQPPPSLRTEMQF